MTERHPALLACAVTLTALAATDVRAGEVAGIHPSYKVVELRPAAFTEGITGMDLLPDGRLAVCTWGGKQKFEGKVHLFSGTAGPGPSGATSQVIADGLKEPMGLKVVGNDIYVTAKDEITRLSPAAGGAYARATAFKGYSYLPNHYHSYASGLEVKDGYFYLNIHSPLFQPPWPQDRGTWIRFDSRNGKHEILARGLREPNTLAVGPDGEFFTTDNQGQWLPTSKLIHLKPGRHYGYAAPGQQPPPAQDVAPPAVWVPHGDVGFSPSQPASVPQGTFAGQLIIGDVRYGGLKRFFLEKVNGEYQGAVFRFCAPAAPFSCGWNRLEFAPDGSLYLGGIGGGPGDAPSWNWNSRQYGLQKLVPTGKVPFELLAVRSTETGFQLEFTAPVGKAAEELSSYSAKQWWYNPTEAYGGSPVGTASLAILSAKVSSDRRKVDLRTADIAVPKVVYLDAQGVTSQDGERPWTAEAWYTLLSRGTALPVALGSPRGPGRSYALERIGAGRYRLRSVAGSVLRWRMLDARGKSIRDGETSSSPFIEVPGHVTGVLTLLVADARGNRDGIRIAR